MRLIHTHTLQIIEFIDVDKPPYAILSHRWRRGEVLLQDMSDLELASRKLGYWKIQRACEEAIKDGYNYLWADTCCIDKSSSVELSEAINSMFRWYKESEVCYAYLWDVTDEDDVQDVQDENSHFRASSWFLRGWTLQELIAPSRLSFFGQHWQYLGTKSSMRERLAQITGIDENTLGGAPLRNSSTAQKMFWASKRQTTRIEDTAYCLLGIFDIHMPLIYGEGERAFQRLQEEIIRRSTDHSIFAWHLNTSVQHGMLADHPAAFASCQDTKPLASSNNIHSYALTNRGLSIKLRGTKLSEHIFLVYLNCTTHLHSNEPSRVGILLQELEEPGQFARIQNAGCSLVPIPIKTSHQDHKFQNKYVDYNIQQTTTRTEYFKFVSGARISLPALSSNEASKFFYFPSAPPDWVTRFVEGSYISLQLIPPHVDKNNPFLRSIKVPKQACAVRLKGSQSLESLDIAFDQLSDFHMQLTSKRIEKSVDIITDVLPDGDLKSLQRLDSSHKVGERWVLKFQRDRIRDDRTFTFNLVVELENGFAIVGFVKIGVVGFAQNVMWDVEIGGPVTESSGTGLKKDGKEKSEKSGRQFWKFLKGG